MAARLTFYIRGPLSSFTPPSDPKELAKTKTNTVPMVCLDDYILEDFYLLQLDTQPGT
jgi:hypothetical protein